MKFVKERVNVICQELARLSISQKIKITDMQVKNGCYITGRGRCIKRAVDIV